MNILCKLKEEFYSKNPKKPILSNEKDQDKRIASEIMEEICKVLDNKYYFKEVVEKEVGTLLDDLSKKEFQIAKNVFVELQIKHPEFVKNYRLKQNMK